MGGFCWAWLAMTMAASADRTAATRRMRGSSAPDATTATNQRRGSDVRQCDRSGTRRARALVPAFVTVPRLTYR
jgi:hypothetical protein